MKKLLAAGAILFAVLVSSATLNQVTAQQPTPSDDEVNAIAKQLYCPVCENTPLDVCPTTACQQWRDLIRQKLSEGKTAQEIKDYFAMYYGDRVLAVPPRKGLNWLVYILPPLSLLAGAAILFYSLRNRSSGKSALPVENNPQAAPAEEDDYIRRMEEELRRREHE